MSQSRDECIYSKTYREGRFFEKAFRHYTSMIDLDTLKALFDDDVLVRKYIDRFAEDMPGLLRKMQFCLEARQWDELSIHAHSYKSQMQYINETVAVDAAHLVEQISAAPSPESEKIKVLIVELEEHLKYLLPQLKQFNE